MPNEVDDILSPEFDWKAHFFQLEKAYTRLREYGEALYALAASDFRNEERWTEWADDNDEPEAELRVMLGCAAYHAGRKRHLMWRIDPDFDGDWSWFDKSFGKPQSERS